MTQATPLSSLPSRDVGLSITELDLSNFRNYQDIRLTLPVQGSHINILVGENGAGKTNLLEALSYLVPGRGLRGARLPDVTLRTANIPWAVAAKIQGREGVMKLGTGILANSQVGPVLNSKHFDKDDFEENESENSGFRRIVHIDGKVASGPASLFPYLLMSSLTPKMDRIFSEGATVRRRFVDRMTSRLQKGHTQHVSRYERLLRERMELLSRGGRAVDGDWLDALERRLAEHAVAISAARLELVTELADHIVATAESPFPKSVIRLDGILETMLEKTSALETEEYFLALLKDSREDDRRAGRTKSGPHKTDFLVIHKNKDMPAENCSTGEQKALIAGLVFTEALMIAQVSGAAPILLLDEIAAHLDAALRQAFFEQLMDYPSQVWMTGTDRSLFAPLEDHANYFKVAEGEIQQLS